jgi:hypothetical protein
MIEGVLSKKDSFQNCIEHELFFFHSQFRRFRRQTRMCFSVIKHQPDDNISHHLASNLQVMHVKGLERWRAKKGQFASEIWVDVFFDI